ncbi:hypothetical protein D8T48_22230 [Vibrio vulnificus]|uniref:hypothetical protein n=1 Tax=Vibrio vulnificus TaxID=672 RepID=UPI00102882EA|nr:hypothetical protein [Vibrio vulnificus]RZP53799.1 hypothetical protein D8T48_22230 [Vibrio vulnificus]
MIQEFDFQWKIHPTKAHRDNGGTKVPSKINTRLPASYIENSDYTLELWMRKKNTEAWDYKSNKITTKHLNIKDLSGKLPCGEKIPQHYWEKPIKEFLRRGYNVARDSRKQLYPLLWWPVLIVFAYLFSKHLDLEDLLAATTTLVTENNSVPTVSLGGIAYAVSLTIYFLIPQKCVRTERFFHSVATNFYGLLIGAMSFVIASRLLEIGTKIFPQFFALTNVSFRTIPSLVGELLYLFIFALLCQYLYGFFILMNKHASLIERIRMFTLCASFTLLFFAFRNWAL